ncbi:MAG: aminopeptidase N [Mobiluncus sp.]|uniref:aminopeptidase N n=1 Tax=Mobiluncus sp. TaxID=47293 RepID=UPI00258A291E|nr:aminopeptidase N [Mobiluncus sp.]MCI6583646.1 aminopeptidase N [Mobiluncus sp.]
MPGQNLTREEAANRSEIIVDAHYRVNLDLTKGDKIFESITEVDFQAREGASTFIDLIADTVHEITLNDQSLDPATYEDSRIPLPDLREHNHLRVKADCLYMHTGEGMHRFTDPEDNKSYVYTQFEVPDARRVYTVFEQPDIKADFTFTVTTPPDWKVLSNSPSPEPEITPDGSKAIHRFTPTEKISSYITAIIAGPYEGSTGELTSIDGRTIPLGVYCRASMVKHLDAEEIMDITRAGFAYYENAFERPYPFRKYDQIFVPEYNAGAMENAGCITFRDEYVFRSRPVETRVERRVETILHELAHMWFGDLVTMKWWNDLWLNESFAEFMSTKATAEATKWTDIWTTFSASEKTWAYRQDQLPSTHPVVATINDLEDVQVNFDGITYAKGACVLSQLVTYVGWDNFRTGIRRYFAKHEWSNATLADLLTELEEASGKDLRAWSKAWLEEAGMTWIKPALERHEDGTIASLRIVQEVFTEGASLRPQRISVRAYNLEEREDHKVFVPGHEEEFDLEGEGVDLPGFAGQKADVLMVNDRDLAYGKVRLDEDSLGKACDYIGAFEQSLPRSQVLTVLWDMVRDGEVSARKFVEVALRALVVETNSTVVSVTLRGINQALESYIHPANRADIAKTTGETLKRLARFAKAGSDAQLQLVRAAARCAAAPEDIQSAADLFTGQESLTGLTLDAEMRWNLLTSLATSGKVSLEEINAELGRDDTVNGRERVLEAKAALPDTAQKSAAFELIYADSSLTNDQLGSLIAGFNRGKDPRLLAPYASRYFDSIVDTYRDKTHEIGEQIIEGLYPSELVGFEDTGVDVLALTRDWLSANADAPAALTRMMKENQAIAERIATAQARDLG